MCAHVKHARINFMTSIKELTIQVQEQVHFKWSANLHLKILTLYDEITHFLKEMKYNLSGEASVDKPKEPPTAEQEGKPLHWALRIKGDLQLLVTISSRHQMVLVASDLAMGCTPDYVGFDTVLLKVSVDEADIFSFESFQMCRINDDPDLREERKKADGFVLKTNKAW